MSGSTHRPAPHGAGPRVRMPRSQRRAQVLRIAQDLFSDHGYHHISMDDIADRAGVSKPVLYRHFPSKLDLYLALIDVQGRELVRTVRTVLDPFREAAPGTAASDPDALAVDGLAVIEGIVQAYVDYARGAGRASTLLFESDVMRDETVRARVLEADAENARVFAEVLVRLTRLAPHEALLVAHTCTAMARTAAAETVSRSGSVTADDVLRLVPLLAWRGVHGMLRREGDSPARAPHPDPDTPLPPTP